MSLYRLVETNIFNHYKKLIKNAIRISAFLSINHLFLFWTIIDETTWHRYLVINHSRLKKS